MRYQRLADGRCLLKDFSSIPDICRDSAFWEWRIYATGNEFGCLLNNGEIYGKKVQAKIIEVLFPSENPLDAELKFVHEDLVASLKSSASHEAKSIAKRIEALSEELNGSGEQDMANVAEEMGIKMPDIDRKSMVDADIEAVKQNVIMGINCTKHPGEDAWEPTITAARLLEKAEKALLRDADAYFAQRAAQEALSLLKANERQIEQLHTLLEQEGSEDDR